MRIGILLVGTYSWDWPCLPSQTITSGVICFDVRKAPCLFFHFLLTSAISVMVIRSFIYFKELISFSVRSSFVSFHYSGITIAKYLFGWTHFNNKLKLIHFPESFRNKILATQMSILPLLTFSVVPPDLCQTFMHTQRHKLMPIFIIIILYLTFSSQSGLCKSPFLLGLPLNFEEICLDLFKLYHILNVFHKYFFCI